jgi:hypothetical protein
MRMSGDEGGWLIPGDASRSNLSEITAGLLKFDAYCLRNKGNGGNNEDSRLSRFEDSRHSDGFGVRGLGAAAGIVAGFGLPRAELSLLRRRFIRLMVFDRVPH